MRALLDLLWKLFSLLGLVLSLRRYWRTVADPNERKEVRLRAGLILLATAVLMLWTLFSPHTLARTAAAGQHEALATPVTPAVDSLVVDLRDDTSAGQIQALDQQFGLDLEPNSPVAERHKLMVADVRRLTPERRAALLARLRQDPRVEAADENFSMTILGEPGAAFEPNDPRYGEQWNFRQIGMPQAWEKTRGKGVVVAVIDTGCAFESEGGVPAASDLKQTRYKDAYDFTKKKAKAYDDHGHGTHVAGTIAQSTNNGHGVAGIAFECTIMPLKVLSAYGSGTVSDIADAINYAADHGAQVINMSLGGPRGAQVMARACRYAHSRGVAIICAAGNTGAEGVGYPAAYPECIAVAAVNPQGNLTFYSTWGKELAIAAPGGEYRPGEDKSTGILQNTVFQKQDTFEFWQGTSMASPHVAGVAALLAAEGYKGPEAIRERLRKTATPKGDEAHYGAGLLNAARAVGAPADGTWVGTRTAPNVSPWLVGLLGTALWPLLAVLTLWGVRPLRPWLGLGSLAFAAGAVALAVVGLGSAWWLIPNALVAALLGGLVLQPTK